MLKKIDKLPQGRYFGKIVKLADEFMKMNTPYAECTDMKATGVTGFNLRMKSLNLPIKAVARNKTTYLIRTDMKQKESN